MVSTRRILGRRAEVRFAIAYRDGWLAVESVRRLAAEAASFGVHTVQPFVMIDGMSGRKKYEPGQDRTVDMAFDWILWDLRSILGSGLMNESLKPDWHVNRKPLCSKLSQYAYTLYLHLHLTHIA